MDKHSEDEDDSDVPVESTTDASSYEPSDKATSASAVTSTNVDGNTNGKATSTSKNKASNASGHKRGKINRPSASCDQCQKKKSALMNDRHARALSSWRPPSCTLISS